MVSVIIRLEDRSTHRLFRTPHSGKPAKFIFPAWVNTAFNFAVSLDPDLPFTRSPWFMMFHRATCREGRFRARRIVDQVGADFMFYKLLVPEEHRNNLEAFTLSFNDLGTVVDAIPDYIETALWWQVHYRYS